MARVTNLLLAIAAAQQVSGAAVEKRQSKSGDMLGDLASLLKPGNGSMLGGLGPLLNPGPGGLAKFMGEPEATESLTSLAKLLGASKTSAGSLQAWTANVNKGFGLVSAPPNAIARRVTEQTRIEVSGAKTIKIRYGPYKVPSSKTKNQLGHMGMLANFPHSKMEKPCSGDCTLMGMSAGLEYLDGTNANINTGLWLHHMVLFNVGPGRSDPTCEQRDVSVPHVTVGATSRSSERIFASGNERTWGVWPKWGVKDAGYKLRDTDSFAMLIELMNENPEDKTVWLTMTYDFVEGHPFKDEIKIIWFDVRQCGTSEVNPPKGKSKFVLDWAWTTSIDGTVVGSIEHLHDGGASMTLAVDGEVMCDSKSLYGTKPEFVSEEKKGADMPGEGHSHGGTGMKHISEQVLCEGQTLGKTEMKKGQKWELKANYDFDQFTGQQHEGGEFDEVMGIAIMFVRIKG